MAKTEFIVKLVYPDQSVFIVGAFGSQAEADAWIAHEQSKPNWNQQMQVVVDQNVIETPSF